MTTAFPYKKILVLGATSGIGEALLRRFVQDGASVIAVGRRKERLERLVHDLGDDKVSAVPFDITNIAAIPDFVKGVINLHPDLDYILFNSGMQRRCDFSDPGSIDISEVSTEFITNYVSYLALTKGFLPFLQDKHEETALCYVTSGLALVPITRCANYCATKAALHSFIMTLRAQLSDTKIRVVELLPPAVQTELHSPENQPDMKGEHDIGMPLNEFIDQAYVGLASKAESIPVGHAQQAFDSFEQKRLDTFRRSNDQIRANSKPDKQ